MESIKILGGDYGVDKPDLQSSLGAISLRKASEGCSWAQKANL